LGRKVFVLGVGNIGFPAALDLRERGYHVVLADASPRRLKELSGKYGFDSVVVNALSPTALFDLADEADLVVVALPGGVAFRALANLLDAGVRRVVDVSFFPEDPFLLEREAGRRGAVLVVDAGVAPGLSNILVARSVAELGEPPHVRVYVGGLSADESAPLGLAHTWNLEDLVDEYVRPARAIQGGRIVERDPLDDSAVVSLPGLGLFEAMPTDGLRTLLRTMRGKVRSLAEYTLRYPGHVEKMKFLRALGLLSNARVAAGGCSVEAKKVLAKLLEGALRGYRRDRVVLMTEAYAGGRGVAYVLDERYDSEREMTAMAKVTSSVLASLAEMVASGELSKAGVVPPEVVGEDEALFRRFADLLSKREVRLERRELG